MKKLLFAVIAGLVLAAAAILPAAVPDPIKLDTGLVSGVSGPQHRDRSSGRAMVLGDRVEAETTTDSPRLALYDSLFAKQLGAKPTH